MTTDTLELAKLDILGRLDEIHSRLKEADPNLPTHLSAIHKTLLGYEELVHILSDEQIGIYMAGMAKYKNIKLVEEASKARSNSRKKLTEDDF